MAIMTSTNRWFTVKRIIKSITASTLPTGVKYLLGDPDAEDILECYGEGYKVISYEDIIEEDIVKKFRFSMLRKMRYCAEKRLFEISSRDVFVNIEQPLLKVLADMENTGIKCDRKILENADLVLTSKLNSLENEIYNISMEKFNINSPKQLSYILYEKLMLPNLKKNATDILTLNELKSYPIVPLVIE